MKTVTRYSLICCFILSFFLLLFVQRLFLRIIRPEFDKKSSCNSDINQNPEFPPLIEDIKPSLDPKNCTISQCMSRNYCQTLTLSMKKFSTAAKFHTVQFGYLLQALKHLPFYVDYSESERKIDDVSNSCFTMFNIDVLDRDILNPKTIATIPDFSLAAKFMKNNEGRTNFVFFNAFSGTVPDYSEEVDFDVQKGILVKSSVSYKSIRFGYDLAYPLVNLMQIDLLPKMPIQFRSSSQDHYLATFKGKRYVHGVGSETRDILPVISNQKDIVSVVTCEHNGEEWKRHLSSIELYQCEASSREYNRPEYDYNTLMLNSTFCFVPRGRRADSFRLLEVMRSGCIPVVMSNNQVLPFNEVIEWEKIAVIADERLVTLIPSHLRNMRSEEVIEMKRQVHFMYHSYFSSVDTILRATFKILYDRLKPNPLPKWVWNSYPGALFVDLNYSTNYVDFPFWRHSLNDISSGSDANSELRYSIVVWSGENESGNELTKCSRIVEAVSKDKKAHNVILAISKPVLSLKKMQTDWLPSNVQLKSVQSVYDLDLVAPSDAPFVIMLDCSHGEELSPEQIELLIEVASHYPDRLIGFQMSNHYLSSALKNEYTVVKETEDYYTMVNLTMAIHHKYYYHLLRTYFNSTITAEMRNKPQCNSVIMNMLVGHVTQTPSIGVKMNKNKQPEEMEVENRDDDQNIDEKIDESESESKSKETILSIETDCLNWFRNVIGYVPLKGSNAIVQV